jgi:hypothetical protein
MVTNIIAGGEGVELAGEAADWALADADQLGNWHSTTRMAKKMDFINAELTPVEKKPAWP